MTLQNGLARHNKQSKATSDKLGKIFAINNRCKMFKSLTYVDLQIGKEKHHLYIKKKQNTKHCVRIKRVHRKRKVNDFSSYTKMLTFIHKKKHSNENHNEIPFVNCQISNGPKWTLHSIGEPVRKNVLPDIPGIIKRVLQTYDGKSGIVYENDMSIGEF